MNLLAIETSGPSLSVAVKKGKCKTREASLKGFSRHAENLLPLIDKLLKKERLKIGHIDAFLIGRGPGSFTGLRVGFATLMGFLAVRPRPCYGAFSFDLIAAGWTVKAPKSGENLAVCLNAKRDKIYTRLYRRAQTGWKPAGKPFVASPEDWVRLLPKDAWVAGDGLPLCQGLPKEIRRVPERDWRPRATALIELFLSKNPMLKKLESAKALLPFYLRSSEAEERLKKTK